MSSKKKTTEKKRSLFSLNMISLLAFSFFVLVLSNAMYFGQREPLNNLINQQNLVANTEAERVALKLKGMIDEYGLVLNGLALSPQVQQLFTQGTPEDREQFTATITSKFPNALSLRMIEKGHEHVDSGVSPGIGYACIDLMKETVAQGDRALAEIHEQGNPQQHVDIIQPVYAGKQLLGYIQLNLDIKVIQEWLDKVANDVYVELHQVISGKVGPVLYKAGYTSNYGFHAIHRISGSLFEIEVWTPHAVRGTEFNVSMLIALGAAIILSGVLVFVLRTMLRTSIRHDLENFLQIIGARLQGKNNVPTDFRLAEFSSAVHLIDNLKLGSRKSTDREREVNKPTPEAAAMLKNKTLSNIPPPDSGIAVSEMDSLEEMSEPEVPEIPAEIFKAYDIRGIVGKTLTAESVYTIGMALGSEAVDRGLKVIVVARDGRLSGPELSKALIGGLQATGLHVVDVGMVPTPVLYFAANELSNGTGVMLTGSHNPPDYNGLKMMLGGETLSGETIQKLRQRILQNRLRTGKGNLSSREVLNEYLKRIISSISMDRRLKIVVDCGNGVAGVVAEKLFAGLGCEVIPLYCEVDGRFPNHHPDPSQPENLTDVTNAVKKYGADLGLAFDGDGDRVGVISSDGRVIWPDRLMMLFAKDILSRNPGAQIIYDIKCSSNLAEAIREKGGQPLMWKTGHSLIKAKMKETGALLAGEMSGHIFFKERWYGFDDGLYAATRLLEILSNDLRQPRVVFSNLPDSINTPELKIHMQEGQQFSFIDMLVNRAGEFSDAEVSLIDGIRVDYPDGWGLVRASNTTPCLVLRFEGKDKDAMARVQEKFRQVLLSIRSDLALPF